jgi:hypothetical protein
LRRLAWLIPPPHHNTVRYHGLCAARARDRDTFVALAPAATAHSPHGDSSAGDSTAGAPFPSDTDPFSAARRQRWATLLARVFAIDILHCAVCGGHMRVLAAVTDPTSIAAILSHLSLPTTPPPIAPARVPPDTS